MKKIICSVLLATLILSTGCSKGKSGAKSEAKSKVKIVYDATKAVQDSGSVTLNDIPVTEATKLMGTGWNLGNTFEATGGRGLASETSWNQPKTTKQMIDKLADYGIKTFRMPVSWSNHIIDDKYTIDPEWMNRVKEVVDWAIGDGMYVILNCHHDNYEFPEGLTAGKGYYPSDECYALSQVFIANIWSQIALAFNNGYDEHLIFEILNEPRLRSTDVEWTFSATNPETVKAAENISKLVQTGVDVIRKSGGNNSNRYIMFPGYAATPDAVLADTFTLPTDTAVQKLIVSVHMYTPYIFAGQSPGATKFTPQMQQQFALTFKKLNAKFVQNGTAVIIGEYGAVNKDNLEERVKWFTAFIKYSQFQNLPAVLWDNGSWRIPNRTKDYSEKYGFYDRLGGTWYFPEIYDAIMAEVK